jgi:hypothetical protein
MNPTLHRPVEVELVPTPQPPSPFDDTQNLFTLRMRYRTPGNVFSYQWVHVPKSLQPALLSGDVASLHLESFEQGSRAQNHLRSAQSHVILGVKTKSGVELEEVPKELRRGWVLDVTTGWTACLLGAILVAMSYAWIGCLLVLFGSHRLRDARQIPRKAFWVNRQVG